ncbi:hypothetical protein VUR80DRAFT_5096 [Thermomyces stellatus]
MRVLVLSCLLLIALLIHHNATHPSTPAHQASVLLTASYALGGGTLTNSLCAAGAYATAAVPRGMECEACVPWSVVAVALTARLHVFSRGGWGGEERAYAWGLGRSGVRWVVGGPGRWFETFGVWEGETLVGEEGLGEKEGLAWEGEDLAGETEG